MRARATALACVLGLVAATCGLIDSSGPNLQDARAHLKHLIFIMQENRSFDSYFGT